MPIPMIQALTDKSAANTAEAFGAPDTTTPAMRAAILGWRAAYFGEGADKEHDPCMRMAYTIVQKLQKGVFAEYRSDILDKDKSEKGAWMDANLSALDAARGELLQWMLIGDECWAKPVPRRLPHGKTGFAPRVIRRHEAAILGRAADSTVTAIGTAEHAVQGGRYYTLFEKRAADGNGRVTIENRLYRSYDKHTPGVPAPLTELAQYAALPARCTWTKPVGGLGLAALRMPAANCVDGSADAVSVYAPAMRLIERIDRNERQLCEEFELARHRITVPEEMLKRRADGGRALRDSVFVALEDGRQELGPQAFSPALRDEPYERRAQHYLRAVENLLGMKRGMLSNAAEVEKTAFEIASTAGDYNLSLIDLQRAWYDFVREYLALCDRLGQMYGYCGESAWDASEKLAVTWGNGVLYDPDKQWQEDCEMVRMGYMKPELALARRFDLPWECEADLAAIRAKYMPDANDLAETERLR